MKKENKDIFFVELQEPDEVRRNILESLKDIVETLQKFEKFKELRKKKIDGMNKLGGIIREANRLVANLKNSLPKTELKAAEVISKSLEEKKIDAKKMVGKVEKGSLTELQRLEAALKDIEEKLQSLR